MTERGRLPNRRQSIALMFEHEGHCYRASATRYDDGSLAEIFLDCGQAESAMQQHLLLQHGVSSDEISRSISGAIAGALELAGAP